MEIYNCDMDGYVDGFAGVRAAQLGGRALLAPTKMEEWRLRTVGAAIGRPTVGGTGGWHYAQPGASLV